MTPEDRIVARAVDRVIDWIWGAFAVGLSIGVLLGWLT